MLRPLLALALLHIAACAPRAPEPPGPVTVTPLPTRPITPSPDDAPLVLASGRFAYVPGAWRYEVTSETEIRPADDALAAPAVVRTRSIVSLRLDPLGGDSLRVTMAIDSVQVERDSLVPAPDDAGLPAGLRLAAVITQKGEFAAAPAAGSDGCTPGEPLLSVARDLLLRIPNELRPGATWADTTSVTVCRGGVPVTTGVARDYAVMRVVRGEGGAPVVTIRRTTRFSMAGTATTALGQTIALTGNGESAATLSLDLNAGVVRDAEREGTSVVRHVYGRRTTAFTQRVTERVRLLTSR